MRRLGESIARLARHFTQYPLLGELRPGERRLGERRLGDEDRRLGVRRLGDEERRFGELLRERDLGILNNG